MAEPGFSFDTSAVDDHEHGWLLKARGDLDLDSADGLYQGVAELAERGAKLVVLDLTDVEFLDSTGLRAIVNAGDLLKDRGGRLVIDGMSGAAKRVLEITSLLEHYSADPRRSTNG
jgi:anti-sigma B factor antagonist